MQTSELQFNIIYTPGTVRYLTPFIKTLLQWSDCRYRLVANGCLAAERELLAAISRLDDRLELLVMPQPHMAPHGETLDYLHQRTDSDHFCFMDSDIVATGPFMDEFRSDIEQADLFSSCLPLWHNRKDTVIPPHFNHMHGIHGWTTDGMVIACDYFVIYDNQKFVTARDETGVGLAVISWDELSDENRRQLREMDQQRQDYDSGKALTLLMTARGADIRYQDSDSLKHIGGFTEAGAIEGTLLYRRGRWDDIAGKLPDTLGRIAFSLADAWYAWKVPDRSANWSENIMLCSRVRRRTATSRYFYLLLTSLMDDAPVPQVPRLGDPVAEQRLADVTEELRTLAREVRSEPGPWQDREPGSTSPA